MLVNIEFSQVMKFQKEVEIDDQEYFELRDLNNEDFNESVTSYHLVQGLVTPLDIYDCESEIKDFYIKAVVENKEN